MSSSLKAYEAGRRHRLTFNDWIPVDAATWEALAQLRCRGGNGAREPRA